MLDKRAIGDSDLEILRAMNAKQETIFGIHSKIRRDFLRTEAIILREQGSLEREFKTLVLGVAEGFGLPPESLGEWKLDLVVGALLREVPDPEPEPIIVETPEIVPEELPPGVAKETVLDKIRRKYQGK